MKNKYLEMKEKQQQRVNDFDGWFFAFSKEQFEKGMKSVGLKPTDTDKVVRTFGGGFVLKDRVSELDEIFRSYRRELEAAIDTDKTGDGFIYDMFVYELNNHEYSYTGDATETLDSLGLTMKEVMNNIPLCNGFGLAIESCLENAW